MVIDAAPYHLRSEQKSDIEDHAERQPFAGILNGSITAAAASSEPPMTTEQAVGASCQHCTVAPEPAPIPEHSSSDRRAVFPSKSAAPARNSGRA